MNHIEKCLNAPFPYSIVLDCECYISIICTFPPLFSIMFPQTKANTVSLQKYSRFHLFRSKPTIKNSEYCIYIIVAHLWFLSNILVPILELTARLTPSITMPCSKCQPYNAPSYQSTTEDHNSSSFFRFASMTSLQKNIMNTAEDSNLIVIIFYDCVLML